MLIRAKCLPIAVLPMTRLPWEISRTNLNSIVFDNKTGCRFLTVDAYLNAVPFYEKNGFRFMNAEDDDPHTRLMYYDLMNLVA